MQAILLPVKNPKNGSFWGKSATEVVMEAFKAGCLPKDGFLFMKTRPGSNDSHVFCYGDLSGLDIFKYDLRGYDLTKHKGIVNLKTEEESICLAFDSKEFKHRFKSNKVVCAGSVEEMTNFLEKKRRFRIA